MITKESTIIYRLVGLIALAAILAILKASGL